MLAKLEGIVEAERTPAYSIRFDPYRAVSAGAAWLPVGSTIEEKSHTTESLGSPASSRTSPDSKEAP